MRARSLSECFGADPRTVVVTRHAAGRRLEARVGRVLGVSAKELLIEIRASRRWLVRLWRAVALSITDRLFPRLAAWYAANAS
jgi:hypothetical protein